MNINKLYDSFLPRVQSDYTTAQDFSEITIGKVLSVDPYTMKMTVDIPILGINSKVTGININLPVTTVGAGFRFVPIPEVTYVILGRGMKGWVHLGYFLEGIENGTFPKDTKEVTSYKPFISLNPGEVEVTSIGGSKLYLNKSGDVLIETGYNDYILLDSVSSLLNLFISTGKFEFSGVRLRAGDILRNADSDPKEEEYKSKYNDPKQLREFSVFVGTAVDPETGLEPEIVDSSTNVNKYPTIGVLSLSTEVTDVRGQQEKIQSKILQFLLRMASGIGIGITDQGEFLLYDYATQDYVSFQTGKQDNTPKTQLHLKIQNAEVIINPQDCITIKNTNFTFFIDKEQVVKIYNQKSSIEITKENQITIKNDKGSIQIASSGDMTIKGGNNAVTIQLTSSGLQIQSNGPVQIQSSGGITLTGSPVSINGALTIS